MEILRIYLKLPPHKGGMEQHVKNLSIEQNKLGHNVTIVFNQGEKVQDGDIQLLKRINLFKIRPQFIAFFIFYIYLIFYFFINKKQVDIIHIHGDWSSLVFYRILKNIVNAKVVAFSHHGHFDIEKLTSKIMLKLIKKIDICFCTGYETYSKLLKYTSNVYFQPSGIRQAYFNHRNPKDSFEKKIVTVANLVPKKNINLIIDIAQILKDYTFTIIGDGPEKQNIKQRIEKLKLNNISLLGYMNDESIIKSHFQNSIFLMTSIEEGFPTSILEAMSSGLAIVSSNAGKVDFLVKEGVNGYIINTHSTNDYIEKIRLLENDIDMFRTISANNINFANAYTWNNVAKIITNKILDLKKL
jgi:glycosyltransferase involved in cell wall biosynthesis